MRGQEGHEPGAGRSSENEKSGQEFGRSLHSEGRKDEWIDDMNLKKADFARGRGNSEEKQPKFPLNCILCFR